MRSQGLAEGFGSGVFAPPGQQNEHADGHQVGERIEEKLVDDLASKTLAAAREHDVQTLFVSGGVAANRALRATFEREAGMQGISVFFPSRGLSTDNAAMIAAAAYPKFLAHDFLPMDFSAEAGLKLG